MDKNKRRPRFTRRLIVLEDLKVVRRLKELAQGAGHSLGAEVRVAIRYWLKAHERE